MFHSKHAGKYAEEKMLLNPNNTPPVKRVYAILGYKKDDSGKASGLR